MYTLDQVWNQAIDEKLCVELDTIHTEARLLYGCKLVRDRYTGKVQFYNTMVRGDRYILLKDYELRVFTKHGLKQGVYSLMMNDILGKIEDINQKIRTEVNNRNNPNRISTLKNLRTNLINSFYRNTKEFKQRNYVSKGKEISLGGVVED